MKKMTFIMIVALLMGSFMPIVEGNAVEAATRIAVVTPYMANAIRAEIEK